MKNILLLLLLIAIPSQAEIISRNLIGTAADIHLTSNYQKDSGIGELQVKLCPDCKPYILTTTLETKVSNNNTRIKLAMLETYLNAHSSSVMRLQFNKNTNQVIHIILKRTNKEYPQ